MSSTKPGIFDTNFVFNQATEAAGEICALYGEGDLFDELTLQNQITQNQKAGCGLIF